MPNYDVLGLSSSMGPRLREFVECQLVEDLLIYGVSLQVLKFDWSESCIEGHDAEYLDGSFENFSGIAIFDRNDLLIAQGWMDFVQVDTGFFVYWDYLEIVEGKKLVSKKVTHGIPNHIWEKLPIALKESKKADRMLN